MWQQFTKLSGPVGSSALDDVFNRMAAGKDEFETPQAAVTKVLVAGATGRCARAARLLWYHLGQGTGRSAGKLYTWLGRVSYQFTACWSHFMLLVGETRVRPLADWL